MFKIYEVLIYEVVVNNNHKLDVWYDQMEWMVIYTQDVFRLKCKRF